MLSDWRGWVIVVVLFITTYIQIVGKHIELLSGVSRVHSAGFYRQVFGGPPWVQWFLYRWSGFIQLIALALTGWLFGWKAAGLTTVALLGFALFGVWRIARSHASEILRDIMKRIDEQERAETRAEI